MVARELVAAAGVTAVVAAVMTAGLVTAPAASAAQGVLKVGQQEYRDPSGCYPNTTTPLMVENRTDRIVVVFHDSHCAGERIGWIAPGGFVVSEFGGSVHVR
ncbi:hypothetical protein [Actinosynnema sp. NPDC023587]|uniref:hypothetical protein n=1 Tax=Actinosynnema sp. NPDC023587 TaxID=3154695 RepID=UPI0033CBA971